MIDFYFKCQDDLWMAKTIDEMINGFEKNQSEQPSEERRRPITFWLPERYKEQYDVLQAKSKRRLGKLLTEIVIQSIDRVTKTGA